MVNSQPSSDTEWIKNVKSDLFSSDSEEEMKRSEHSEGVTEKPQIFQTPLKSNITIIPLSVLDRQSQNYRTNSHKSHQSHYDDNQSVRSNVSHRYKRSIIIESNAQRKRQTAERKKSTLNLSQLLDESQDKFQTYLKTGDSKRSYQGYQQIDERVSPVFFNDLISTHSVQKQKLSLLYDSSTNNEGTPKVFDNEPVLENKSTQFLTQMQTNSEMEPRRSLDEAISLAGFGESPTKTKTRSLRMNSIIDSVENDSLDQFICQEITHSEMVSLRFEYSMNLLQFVCHEEAVLILNYLVQQLEGEVILKQQMVNHRDAHLGSQAIHLAAATGNHQIIETLINYFAANVKETTNSMQTVHHCASQRYEGIAAIFLFKRIHKIEVNAVDDKEATALHFAAISLYIKNIQALIKLGADPNVQDIEGNTPMHLALETLIDEPQNFEKVKNIVKELIFSGAQRGIMNKLKQKPADLLVLLKDGLSVEEFDKLEYIMTPPTGNRYLRMTRPIEKVERGRGCQMFSLVLNIFVASSYGVAGAIDYLSYSKQSNLSVGLLGLTLIFFLLTLVFYGLTMLNPGYVQKQPNFLRLLKKLIAENYHLDYVCVPCETLRPENADHCNFCNRCVQKFDHHCVFVNNCLGYRNHKWFLLFLISFSLYMLAMLIHSLILIYRFSTIESYQELNTWMLAFQWIVQLILIGVVLLHSPIVFLQLKSQFSKLCRLDEENQLIDSSVDEITTNFEYESRTASFVQNQQELNETIEIPSRWKAFQKNIAIIFSFEPQSQEYLYSQLFGDCDNPQNNSGQRVAPEITVEEIPRKNRESKGLPLLKWMNEDAEQELRISSVRELSQSLVSNISPQMAIESDCDQNKSQLGLSQSNHKSNQY